MVAPDTDRKKRGIRASSIGWMKAYGGCFRQPSITDLSYMALYCGLRTDGSSHRNNMAMTAVFLIPVDKGRSRPSDAPRASISPGKTRIPG
jgi:hypothetical protein